MKREDIQEYLDCNGFEALTSFDGTKYYNEEKVISIALQVVKNCSIPVVVGRSEQLVCDCMPDPTCRVEDNKVLCNGCNKERK